MVSEMKYLEFLLMIQRMMNVKKYLIGLMKHSKKITLIGEKKNGVIFY